MGELALPANRSATRASDTFPTCRAPLTRLHNGPHPVQKKKKKKSLRTKLDLSGSHLAEHPQQREQNGRMTSTRVTQAKKDELCNEVLCWPVNGGYTQCRDVLSQVSLLCRCTRSPRCSHRSLINNPSLPEQDLLFSAPIFSGSDVGRRFCSSDLQESEAPPPLVNAFISDCRSASARVTRPARLARP